MFKLSETYTYGNNQLFAFESLKVNDQGNITSNQVVTDRASISQDNYSDALDDIQKSLTVLEDVQTGKQFEIALANLDASEGVVDAELSTFSSSITGNIGNAIEFAEHSALYPNKTRLYIASLGNGGSSYWDEKERKYITKTGRFTQENGEPLPTIAALERTVRQIGGLSISRFTTNSAGGAYATALMTALPEGQVTHGYFKSRPNISNHPTKLLWGAGLMLAEQYDSRQYKANTQDEWNLTDEIIEAARPKLARIYGEKVAEWSVKGTAQEKGIKRLYWDMLAFSRGGKDYDYPASHDTSWALAKQPEAKLTYHFPEKDRLYSNLRHDVAAFLQKLNLCHSEATHDQVEAVIMPGTHHDHSAYPSLRWSIEKYAFTK